MPEHFRALIVILFVASVVFVMARKPALDIIPPADFKRRRNLWFGLTLLAFFSHSFWLYAAATAVILYVVRRREHNVLALFFILLFGAMAAWGLSEYRFKGKEVVIQRVGDGVLLMPIEDPWVTIEVALNAFEPDFKIERQQPEHQIRPEVLL